MIPTDVTDILYDLWMRCANASCRWTGPSESLHRAMKDGQEVFVCPRCGGAGLAEHREELAWHQGRCPGCGQIAAHGKLCKRCQAEAKQRQAERSAAQG